MNKQLSVALSCLIIVSLTTAFVGIASVHAMAVAQEATVRVSIGINYGTGPVVWPNNNTIVPSGESLLNATMRVATVETLDYPSGNIETGPRRHQSQTTRH